MGTHQDCSRHSDALTATDESKFFGCGGLYRYAIQRRLQNISDTLTHCLTNRPNLRLLTQDRDIEIRNRVSLSVDTIDELRVSVKQSQLP